MTFKRRAGLVNEDSEHSWLTSVKQQHRHIRDVHIIKVQTYSSLLLFKPETAEKEALLPSKQIILILTQKKNGNIRLEISKISVKK